MKGAKILLISFLFSLPLWWGINTFQENLEGVFYAQISQPIEEISLVKIPQKPERPELELQARAAVSLKSEKILLKNNINQPLPIASLTKLMTALIVFENTTEVDESKDSSPSSPIKMGSINDYDFSNLITVSEEAASQEDVPIFGNLKAGDKLLLERALELMLIYSSNDAAFALAELVGTENFVEKMNLKAEELELENTHFVNPTGLDPKGIHYEPANIACFNHSTAEDLTKITQYILKKYPKIFEISVSQGPYPTENGTSDLAMPEKFKILGGKTGYTDEAEGCMLLVLEDGKENKYINVILGAPSAAARIVETQKLIDWLAIGQ